MGGYNQNIVLFSSGGNLCVQFTHWIQQLEMLTAWCKKAETTFHLLYYRKLRKYYFFYLTGLYCRCLCFSGQFECMCACTDGKIDYHRIIEWAYRQGHLPLSQVAQSNPTWPGTLPWVRHPQILWATYSSILPPSNGRIYT